MNTTHPEAKSRAEREHDERIWQWDNVGRWAMIVDGNGSLVISGLSLDKAKRIVRLHNSAIGA